MDVLSTTDDDVDDSISESLSDSVGNSESGSSVESVGSSYSEPWAPKLQPNGWIDRLKSRPRKSSSKSGAQFIHFVKELSGVPVDAAWAFVRDHKALASMVPGIIENFNHLEGEGGTGSIYIANYSPKHVRPGDDKYLINKVEVSDDASKLYAVRRLGGQFQRWYKVYMIYMKVLPDDVLGDSSSVFVWRLEYEPRHPESTSPQNAPPPEGTRKSYMIVLDMVKDRLLTMNRVERPIAASEEVEANTTKRLKLRLRAGHRRLTGAADKQDREVSSQQCRRKSRINNDDGDDRESKTKRRSRWTRGKTTASSALHVS